MSNISLIIEERPHQMGKFLVGRLLPFTTKRMVGPFVFIDHMGPVSLNEFENFDVLTWSHFSAHKIPLTLHKDGKKDIKKAASKV
jgi:redox-sensitive bicupin YhaK (pirin superfamily)